MTHSRNDGNETAKDLARTPPVLFNKLNDRWGFNIDLFTNKENSLCKEFYWCNPANPLGFLNPDVHLQKSDVAYGNCPYSNPAPFIARCAEEMLCGATIVMLLPSDTACKAFHKYIMGVDVAPNGTITPNQYGASEIIYLTPRVTFNNPDGTPMKGSPKFGSAVVVFKQEEFDGSPVVSSMRWK